MLALRLLPVCFGMVIGFSAGCGGETREDPLGPTAGAPSVGGSGGSPGDGAGGLPGGGHAGQGGTTTIWPPADVSLERQGAMGFCIRDGQILEAHIVPSTSGGLLISGQIHLAWDRSSPGCENVGCETLGTLGPTRLSSEQEAELRALVTALPRGDCVTGPNPACDPCLISVVTIEGVEFVDDPCAAELCPGYYAALRPLEEYLDGFAARGG